MKQYTELIKILVIFRGDFGRLVECCIWSVEWRNYRRPWVTFEGHFSHRKYTIMPHSRVKLTTTIENNARSTNFAITTVFSLLRWLSIWRCPHLPLSVGTCCTSPAAAGRSAANPPAAAATVDRWDRQTEGRLTATYRLGPHTTPKDRRYSRVCTTATTCFVRFAKWVIRATAANYRRAATSGKRSEAITMMEWESANFYRAMLCIRGTSHGRLSVRLSVTSRCSTKTAKRKIT